MSIKDETLESSVEALTFLMEIGKIYLDLRRLCKSNQDTRGLVLTILDAHGYCKTLRTKPITSNDPTRAIFAKLYELVDHIQDI